FLGASGETADDLEFPWHPLITVHRLSPFGSSLAQILNIFAFVLCTVAICLRYRPQWIYASDHLACPVALTVRKLTGCRVAYHEHDSPTYTEGLTFVQRMVRAARHKLAREAELCILPHARRAESFVVETKREGPTFCVWNCPRREEVGAPPTEGSGRKDKIIFYYHGSLNRVRLPLTILDALRLVPLSAQ